MLKANELRIGNYVTIDNEVSKVAQLGGLINPIVLNIYTLELDITKKIQPIPLTEEWLLKFGFVHSKTDKSNVYKLGSIFRFVYCFDGKFKGKDMLMFGNIQLDKKNHLYVHQLQNLHFALLGKEIQL